MIGSWWLVWMVFMFFLIAPMGYGWGYRGWGAPYPRYVQRRRALRAGTGSAAPYDHQAWGIGGDFLWFLLVFWLVWVCATVWWR